MRACVEVACLEALQLLVSQRFLKKGHRGGRQFESSNGNCTSVREGERKRRRNERMEERRKTERMGEWKTEEGRAGGCN